MIRNIFNIPAIRLMEKGLDLSALRHRIISENIANSETPGYKKKEVSFSGLLEDALANYSNGIGTTDPLAKNKQGDVIREIKTTSMRNDGNNVDVDEEMVKLAQNTLYYQALSQQVGAHFALLKTVINGGGR
jgi:flagellar basal-body rod protein FlgB